MWRPNGPAGKRTSTESKTRNPEYLAYFSLVRSTATDSGYRSMPEALADDYR